MAAVLLIKNGDIIREYTRGLIGNNQLGEKLKY